MDDGEEDDLVYIWMMEKRTIYTTFGGWRRGRPSLHVDDGEEDDLVYIWMMEKRMIYTT